MIALGYLIVMVAFGDVVSRRFFTDVSTPHRLATAFLVGLLISTWLTYLTALLFMEHEQPLLAGNVVAGAMVAALTAAGWAARRRHEHRSISHSSVSDWRGWAAVVVVVLMATWMMTTSLQMHDGRMLFGVHVYGDLAPNTAIAQSFAVGHNYPTEYPFFANAPILYHFLYYFQVGNLTYLGLDPAWANNILSVGSMTSMLVLVMAFGERVFGTPLVGRLAAALFFFHGSLSFMPWLASFSSATEAVAGIGRLDQFISTGLPYRDELWATWTLNVYLNQRHLLSAIGILLVVLLFVVDRLQAGQPPERRALEPAPERRSPIAELTALRDARGLLRHSIRAALGDPALPGYLLCGLLLGLLPLWNAPVFIASAAILAVVLIVFPNRIQMVALALAAALPALPQLLLLRPEGAVSTQFPTFHWGYVVDDPTPFNVAFYLAFIFGPKIVLAGVALAHGNSIQRRLLLAVSSLIVVTLALQLSVDIVASHKFLNVWLVFANAFAAYGLVCLWRLGTAGPRPSIVRASGRLLALGLATIIVIGGAIDLMPIKNGRHLAVRMTGDPLTDWLQSETDGDDIFLSDLYILHPIPLSGRKLYYGWPVYAWSAGYDVEARDRAYRQLFHERSPRDLVRRLQEQQIAYVAIDDGLRESSFLERLNEDVYQAHLEPVFVDGEGRYGNLTIYRVPPDEAAWRSLPDAPPLDMFTGGRGSRRGEFEQPRGIAVAPDGDVLIADTGNHRVQRFTAAGEFVGSFGELGEGDGEFREPNGVAVDSRGHVFVTDTLNHRMQEFDAQDRFVREWRGPEPAFYGPRDIAVGDDDSLYILDQGQARVVKESPGGVVSTFGDLGSGPGQLDNPTGISVAAGFVFVADPANARIQVFDTDGDFLRSEPVPEWGGPAEQSDVAAAAEGRLLYASSPGTDEVIVLDVDGGRLRSLGPGASDELTGPGAMAITPDGAILVVNIPDDRVSLLTDRGSVDPP